MHREEETCSKQVKRKISQYIQYSATVSNAHFEHVSISLRLPNSLCKIAKIHPKLYRMELAKEVAKEVAKEEAAIMSFPLTLGSVLVYELPD